MTFSIVIPTRDREADLLECVDSIVNQTLMPKEVIIVDDGNIARNIYNRISSVLDNANVDFVYLRKDEPGTSRSRNLGATSASGDTVIILDDDIVLDNDYIEQILKVYNEFDTDNLGGVGGVVKNIRKRHRFEDLFDYLFCMRSRKSTWDILPWGVPTWEDEISQVQWVNLMIGGISSYKRDILMEFRFREFQHGGRCANEDIEFFMRVSKKYQFIMTPYAKAIHKRSPIGRESRFKTGVKSSFNRLDTFAICVDKTAKNYICFSWAMFGTIFKSFVSAVFDKRRKVSHISEGIGMIVGVFQYLSSSRR